MKQWWCTWDASSRLAAANHRLLQCIHISLPYAYDRCLRLRLTQSLLPFSKISSTSCLVRFKWNARRWTQCSLAHLVILANKIWPIMASEPQLIRNGHNSSPSSMNRWPHRHLTSSFCIQHRIHYCHIVVIPLYHLLLLWINHLSIVANVAVKDNVMY